MIEDANRNIYGKISIDHFGEDATLQTKIKEAILRLFDNNPLTVKEIK
jgi:hypothetical protein